MNIYELADLITHLIKQNPQDIELIDFYVKKYNELWNEIKEQVLKNLN